MSPIDKLREVEQCTNDEEIINEGKSQIDLENSKETIKMVSN